MLISNQMPDLSRYQKPEAQVQVLYQYIFTLTQQINHVLSNLGTDNLSEELQSTLASIQDSVTKAVQQTGPAAQTQTAGQWPVGAVYWAADAAHNPASLFGGTWEQLDTATLDGLYAWQRKE